MFSHKYNLTNDVYYPRHYFMKKLIVVVLLLPLLCLLGVTSAWAEVISFKRGFPTDIWINWLGNDKFVSDKNINTFPEYRQAQCRRFGHHCSSSQCRVGEFGVMKKMAKRAMSW